MTLVAGVDSSTQSVKVVVRNADTGELLRQARAPHPDATEVDPEIWVAALSQALDGILDGVTAMSIAGQQHGMVVLDEHGEVIRPALLWNDTRSAQDALDLIDEEGGPEFWANAVGSVPVASFTVSKIRWLARCEPTQASRVAKLMLPHDYLSWRLAGKPDEFFTDRGDASGTGYWSPALNSYQPELVQRALGHVPQLPTVLGPSDAAYETSNGLILGAGTGDNMAAALGLNVQPGDVVVSLGTSGTAFAGSRVPSADPTGIVAGFADATGNFLPLVCTLNAARILDSTAAMLGVSLDRLGELALIAPSGAEGLVLIPYFDGERTPNLPDSHGSLHGITRTNFVDANIARAAVEGMLMGMAEAVQALEHQGVIAQRILIIGGAAANHAVAQIAATIFAQPVFIPAPDEYVALGAAKQAAWCAMEGSAPPAWNESDQTSTAPIAGHFNAAVLRAYQDYRGALYDLSR